MGVKFKEINTLSFIGNVGPKTERVWKEIDEEIDIIGCKAVFERPCQLVSPLSVIKRDLPGDGDTRQIPVFLNDDVRIELMHCRAGKTADGRRPAGFYETQVQVENTGLIKTPQGDFAVAPGDVLVLPPGVDWEQSGAGPTTKLIVYTRHPVQVAEGYPVRENLDPWKAVLLEPGTVLDKVAEGGSGGKHFELVENADILIETTHRSDAQRIYHRGFGQDEVAFQLSGRRATRTDQGEYMLETGDFLLIPPGTSHRNIGDMATIRIILYTRTPLQLADEFVARSRASAQPAG